MSIKVNYKGKDGMQLVEGAVPYFQFPALTAIEGVKHGFSTKLGGVSEGDCATMNLSFTRGDKKEAVLENYRRMAETLGVDWKKMVLSQQTHTTNVRVVEKADAGMGIVKPLEYTDVDGLITNEKGICLVTFYADCVPLYFVDPVKKVIGLSHSGWRGTVEKMGIVTVEKMHEVYGSDPADIIAAIGPSICQDCYEVSGEVIERFKENFDSSVWNELFYEKPNGKYQLDLWKANKTVFKEAGIAENHIYISNVCTLCNSDLMFSHRKTGDRRGNLAAFLALTE